MTYRVLDDGGYHLGMIRELPPWRIPAGGVYDASNMLFDIPGMTRQRGGTTALVSGAQTAFATSLGFCYSQDATTIEELHAVNGKTGSVYVINKSTGAATVIGTTIGIAGTIGRPVRHFGFVMFPCRSTSANFMVAMAGQTSNTAFTATAGATVVAGNQQITLGGADTTTNIKVGGIVFAENAGSDYIGRVVSIDSGTTFTVWPTPPIGMTTTTLTSKGYWFDNAGACVTSFQNRLLVGNTQDFSSASSSLISDRRIYYSPLPTETGTSGARAVYGAMFVDVPSWPVLNYVDVPGADPIVAMEPVSADELLILTSQGVVILRGQLATQTSTSAPGITFDISPMNTNAGCLSDLSVQRTPHGIIWASAEGIMLYRGGGTPPADLTENLIHTYWRSLTRGSSFAVHGAAYVRNHYVISGISGGTTFVLALNLDNGAWTTLTDDLDIFYGTLRPSDPSQVFALRWWAQSGTAPSFTNGQTVRLESAFAPDVVGQTKLDADGGAVAFSVTSRALTDDAQSERIARRVAVRYQSETLTAGVTVSAGARIDPGITGGTPTVSLSSLSNTSVLSISAATNATPIAITTSVNHGLKTNDAVDIRGATPNTAANGRWRIIQTGATTFTLNGSKGNGATAAAGTVNKVTEEEYDASGVDIGPATWITISSAGSTVNRFELHGWRAGVLEIPRGMGG